MGNRSKQFLHLSRFRWCDNRYRAAFYHSRGFELGLHINTGCADYTTETLDAFFRDQLGTWRLLYPSLPSPVTHRVHCIAWSGYTTMAEIELNYGVRLDVNYYYWPPKWVLNEPGVFTGSGMPMRFTTVQGQVIDVYQATSQMTDESGQSYPFTIDTLLDRALGPEGYYGAFVANIHTDSSGAPESDEIVASALSRGVPVISARQLLTWLDARNASAISAIQWNANTQSFTVSAHAQALGLEVMVPVPDGASVLSARRNGADLSYDLRFIKGIWYAVLPAITGNYEVVYSFN